MTATRAIVIAAPAWVIRVGMAPVWEAYLLAVRHHSGIHRIRGMAAVDGHAGLAPAT